MRISATHWQAEDTTPGIADIVFQCPGDSDGDGDFDLDDINRVMRSGKFGTAEPATWEEGDWNEDGVFDFRDVVSALTSQDSD